METPDGESPLADERVEITVLRGVAVLRIHTALDDQLVARLAADLDRLGERERWVVVDVCDAVLLAPEPVFEVVERLEEHGADCAVACSRLTGRLLLERWGVSSEVAVFHSAGDAVQAEIMAEQGYGDGWG